jgi:hypothetical protein
VATLAQIRDGIRSIVETAIPTLRVYPRIGTTTTLPAMVITPADTNYDMVMNRSSITWEFDLAVLASAGDAVVGQYTLDDLIDIGGPGSIIAVLFGEDLDLPNTHAHVASMSGYGGTFENAGVEHVGAILRLVVVTNRTGA